jgi:hypothetical protein
MNIVSNDYAEKDDKILCLPLGNLMSYVTLTEDHYSYLHFYNN